MTDNSVEEATDWPKVFAFDKLPNHIVDMRVTDLMDLSGRKALVTGSGADGLGRAIANRLAGLGADVALVDLNHAGATENARLIEEKWGTKAVAVEADLTDWESVHDAFNEAAELLGGLDIVVNNAILTAMGPFSNHTKEEIDFTINGTFTTVSYCCHAALEHMLPQKSGKIINISSVGGRTASKGISLYNASKSATIGLTRNLAHEVISEGVNVLGVAPGIMLNNRLRKMIVNAENDFEIAGRETLRESITKTVELDRASIPEEVANMVGYLASDAASYMVGQTIDVAGGIYMN